MRKTDSFIHKLDIVAEVNGKIVGNIVYTKAKIVDDNAVYHNVISFGPISVLPAFQGKGIGRILIEHTKTMAKELGYTAILIYGDPDYYGRSGFTAAENYKIGTSDNMYAVPLQALELYPGSLSNISGRFLEDEIYDIDEMEAKEFDQGFLPKELLSDLSTQIRFRQLVEMKRPRLRV
ncbi:GNAT family N-acetyltransferase [Clostridium sp.]|uniref:GNAT family N-acetyltransferase n=1 Tax=Clostridium sp. TaxID=1506 RepID=UPI003D6D9C55